MSEKRFDITLRENLGVIKEQTVILVDKETGVNYLFVSQGYAGGLTPLLDENGKPIVTK
ncbi:DUF6440 family protein [Candidatus Enterococcus clewellii]|uniref:DUF6440 domain-containing protein n=1 Tax=Candidatus Enterococcus clewellii TaxID=1834193 RepID=A0A242KCC9_9ENTE|nr:DUF6440 family protein [Enterococcus sp. 9E7_DIV0242]OTP18438.1 hypothetical protein A5888_000252 [Enterococcus sp. 9E7_DIV0242]